nr:MAG TPA: hypothetical protein [Bacteriophage sp.]
MGLKSVRTQGNGLRMENKRTPCAECSIIGRFGLYLHLLSLFE